MGPTADWLGCWWRGRKVRRLGRVVTVQQIERVDRTSRRRRSGTKLMVHLLPCGRRWRRECWDLTVEVVVVVVLGPWLLIRMRGGLRR
jgi:hypothetical protein